MMFTSVVRANRNQTFQLLAYLSNRFSYHSQEEWSLLIYNGKVLVDGMTAAPETMVGAGCTIRYDAGHIDEPPADLNYSILYEDEWLFAVNKPGNLLIHRAGKSFTNNLMYQLRHKHVPPYPTAHSIHRLDRNTSGVVLIAKTAAIQSEISRQFFQRHIEKIYTAFIDGRAVDLPSVIDAPISEDRKSLNGARFHVAPEGKEAITRIIASEPLGANSSKIRLQPLTGRTHQLRVHCAFIGHPIIGDRTYGSQKTFINNSDIVNEWQLLHPRHALHCSEITFHHPWMKCNCTIGAPLPNDMSELEIELRNGKRD